MTMIKNVMLAIFCTMALIGGGGTAYAKCHTLAFSVNDYGKEGPARDAAALLEKHIVDWTSKQGIKKYRKIPKEIKCELFLDVILFDEYTCTASADVCW